MSMLESPEPLSLRPRTTGDSGALLALFSQPRCRFFAQLLDEFSSVEELDAWTTRIGEGNFEVVAMLGSELVGYGGLYPLRGRQSHVGWTSLCVHDALQGRGIGTILLKTLITTADLLAGLTRLQLSVFADNLPAIQLYRKHGFSIEGRHDRFAIRDGEFVAGLTMARLARRPETTVQGAAARADQIRAHLAGLRPGATAAQAPGVPA